MAQSPEKSNRYTPSVRAVFKTMPSVVAVSTITYELNSEASEEAKEGSEFKRLPVVVRKDKVLGSGVIFDSEGLILTNEHVIRDAELIRVMTYKGDRYVAHVVYKNVQDDLAILKIRSKEKLELPVIKFAYPGDVYLAETVITIGNPLGLTFSVSEGILSSNRRRLEMNNKVIFDDLLQTSIKVNPGNSGGPLINLDGEMIGMMSASQTKASGIGFAIPVDRLEKILIGWYSPQNILKAQLDFRVETEFENHKGKAVIKSLHGYGLGATYGLKEGFAVIRVDDQVVHTALDFYRYMSKGQIGKDYFMQVSEGKTFKIQLKKLDGLALAEARLGLTLQLLSADIAKSLSLPFSKGFVVSNVDISRSGKKLSIRRGDMLFKVNDLMVSNEASLQKALTGVQKSAFVKIAFLRYVDDEQDGQYQEVVTELLRIN